MSSTDHLANAREYIAKGDDYYGKAADEILAAQAEDPTLGYREIGERIGRSHQWCRRLVQSRTSVTRADDEPLVVDWQSGSNKRDEVAAKVLKDPEQRKQVIASMPAEALDDLQRETTEAVVNRARAQRQEHHTEPTTSALMGGDRFDPSEAWADTLIIRANRNLRDLARHIEKWGLVLGSMPEDEAYEYMQETERLAAEVRAAVQERIRDGAEV